MISTNHPWVFLCAGMFALGVGSPASYAQTDGGARFEGTILDYNGSGANHWTVAWVTYQDGRFIKSLRKQGPSWTSTHWGSHCKVWNDARGGSASGSQALDGYSSATATTYAGTNSPVIWTWNCRDAGNNLVPDGAYKIWIQYAEDSGQGPHTTNGMSWVKGPTGVTNTYPNLPPNFTNLRVVWTPVIPVRIAAIGLAGSSLVMSGSGPPNKTYYVLKAADANTPAASWTAIATNTFDASGHFSYTEPIGAGAGQAFYRLRTP